MGGPSLKDLKEGPFQIKIDLDFLLLPSFYLFPATWLPQSKRIT